ncbi:AAA family ATPase [Herminiimonas sp. CN]|uniref:AAA family ATPase n=1 Tax=Herminiimonas sp. CN TaxID=1349818 RepID=UPI000473B952|nr:AAA family ATPase [Herminiimonas sp. CN]
MSVLFHLKTFGNFALTEAATGTRLPIPAGKAQALLTYLALHQEPATREWLADFLWPELPADAGRFNLRHTFFHLRRLCGDALFHQNRHQIGIARGRLRVDALLLLGMTRTDMNNAIDLAACEALIEACQESFLPGFWLPDCDDFETWLDHTRQSLLRQQVSLLETLAEQRVLDGHPELGIHHARRLTHLMPYDDGARRRLMRYLIDTRCTTAALAEFEHFAALLAREIGAQPEEETRRLSQTARTAATAGQATMPANEKKMPQEKEWRIATALYCERAETCDGSATHPAEYDAMEDGYPESVTAAFQLVVTEHGGLVIPAPSGGLLAYFGYPVALERAPAAAITAGLALSAAFAGSGLQFRFGAHLGRTLCDQERPDISGEMARVVQRICLVAEPGQLVVNATLPEAQSRFHMVSLGSHVFRGLSRTFHLYRVERGAPAQPIAVIIGREYEQGMLNSALTSALSGDSVCFGLQGEAGMGKTTLAAALGNQALQAGAFVIKLHCASNLDSTPLYPVRAWLREHFGLPHTGPELIEPLIAALAKVGCSMNAAQLGLLFALPINGDASDSAHAAGREDLLSSLLRLLAKLATMAPVMIIVDDMHWIDPSTLELINRAHQARHQRTLLLLTSRIAFETAAKPDQCMTLGPLTQVAASELAQLTARPGTHAQRIAEWVAKAEGSPFFLRELAHSEGGIPANVHAALQARLDQLGTAKRVAQMAAVLGRKVRLDEVATLCQLAPEHCALRLQKLVDASVLMNMAGTDMQVFRHALMQEAAYRSLVTADRQQSHLAAALLLTATPERYRPEQIAYHYQQAATWGPAAHWLLLAGNRYAQLGANREALTHLAAGIEAAGRLPPDDDQRHNLSAQLKLARIVPLVALHGYGAPEPHEAVADLHRLAPQLLSVAARFKLKWGAWCGASSAENYQAALPIADELMQLAHEADDDALADYATYARGSVEFWQGRLAQASRTLANIHQPPAAEIQRALHKDLWDNVWVNALAFESWIAWLRGQPMQARRLIGQSSALADMLGDPAPIAFSLVFKLELARLAMDFATVEKTCRELTEISHKNDFTFWCIVAAAYDGWLLARDSDNGGAKISINAAHQVGQAMPSLASIFHMIAAEALLFGAQFEASAEQLAAAQASMARHGERYLMAECERLLGYVRYRQGNATAAIMHLEAALALAQEQGAIMLLARIEHLQQAVLSNTQIDLYTSHIASQK